MEFKELQQKIVAVIDDYGKKYNIDIDEEYALHKLSEEMGEFAQAWLIYRHKCRPEKLLSEEEAKKQLGEELSDLIGMVVLNANLLDIDLEKAIDEKWLKYLK